MDNSVSIETLNQIQKALSNRTEDTLEKGIQALYKLFKGNGTAIETNDREDYYARLIEIKAAITGQVSIVNLVDKTAIEIKTEALNPDALALRYALRELNPFIITGDDSIYARHNLNGELELYDPSGNRAAGMTSEYLADRAALLAWANTANTQDRALLNTSVTNENWQFTDIRSNYILGVTGEVLGTPSTSVARQAIFGSNGADVLEGGTGADRLYGGSGTDYLAGKGGNDYLEGGAGLDIYQYNGTKNLLSPDVNDGSDTIRDTDGKGVIRYTFTEPGLPSSKLHSTVIAEASVKLSDTEWQSADGKFTYTKNGADLVVTINGDAGGSLTLKDFKDGQYGIRLWEARLATVTTVMIAGDKKPQDADPAAEGTQIVTDSLGNAVVTTETEADRADTLYGDRPQSVNPFNPHPAGEKIDAGGGNDDIYSDRPKGQADNGLGDADWILGGSGRDYIDAGAGNDLIEAGADGDIVEAGASDDEIYAETKLSLKDAIVQGNLSNGTLKKGDYLSGGAGEDWIVGGQDRDTIDGGQGKDLILGGAGDDNIDGDVSWSDVNRDWYVTRKPEIAGSRVIDFTLTGSDMGLDVSQDVDAGDADVIYGGSGNDWIYGRGGDDFIDGGADNDNVSGGAGSDIIIGGLGDDVLIGDKGNVTTASDGADYLDGGDGNDTLWGNGGDDILIGGRGNDYLNGGDGKDIYIFNKGDGVEVIDDVSWKSKSADASVIVFGAGIKKEDVRFSKGSLLIDLGPSDPADANSSHDAIHFEGFDYENPEASHMISELRFDDGQVMTYADILAQGFDINGTDGNDDASDLGRPQLVGTGVTDRIRGYAGNDVLIGLRGDDVLRGGAGDDTYVFNLGDGHDVIIDNEGISTIFFGPEITPDAIRLSAADRSLVVRYSDYDTITVKGVVQQYRFSDGTVIEYEEMMSRLSDSISVVGTATDETIISGAGSDELWGGAGNDILKGGAGNDYLFGEDGDDTIEGGLGNDTLFGQAGNDTIQAGHGADQLVGGEGYDTLYGGVGADRLWGQAGDDQLYGGDGDDELNGGEGVDALVGGRGDDLLIAGGTGTKTYVFDIGDGKDTILNTSSNRRIQFGAGIAPSDIKVYLSPTTVPVPFVLIEYSAQDSVLVQLGSGSGPVEYCFADGSTMAHGSLVTLALQGARAQNVLFGTPGSDNLSYPWNSVLIEGGAGNDQLKSGGGNDTLRGGSGDDALTAGYGDDVLDGGTGNDTLHAGGGQDALRGGAGNDILNGDLGSDTYLYSRGDGNDTIIELSSEVDANVLRFTDLVATDVTFSREASGSLRIHINESSDTIEIRNWYNDPQRVLQQIEYADGTVFNTSVLSSLEQVKIIGRGDGDQLTGTSYNDVIVGTSGNDTINGKEGNDHITGGAGSDSYLMYRGMGLDSIYETTGSVNVLRLAPGHSINDLSTVRKGNDLHVYFTASNDGVVLKEYFSGNDAWTVAGNDGQNKSIDTLIADAATRPVTETVPEVRDRWIAQSQLAWIQSRIDYITSYNVSDDRIGSITYNQSNPYALSETWTYHSGQMSGRISQHNHSFKHFTRYSNNVSIENDMYDWTGTSYYVSAPTMVTLPAGQFNVVGSKETSYTVTDYGRLDSTGSPITFTILPGGGLPSGYWDPALFADDGAVGGATQYEVYRTRGVMDLVYDVEHIVAGPSNNFIQVAGRGSVDAGDGDDFIYAGSYTERFHFLYGGAGNDILIQGDILIGGDGNDYLASGGGDDTYYLMANESGMKIIDEVAERWNFSWLAHGFPVNNYAGYGYGEVVVDTVEFGAGINIEDLHVQYGRYDSPYDEIYDLTTGRWRPSEAEYDTLDFSWGDGKLARVLLADNNVKYHWNTGNGKFGIENFKFSDGTMLSMAEMRALVSARNPSDDTVLVGTNGDDHLNASSNGADYTFNGGAGNDVLIGGTGNDTFLFNPGDGVDRISDIGGNDTIQFGAGITADSLSLDIGSLLVRVGSTGDAIHIEGFDPNDAIGSSVIEQFTFADGTTLTYEQLLARGFDIAGSGPISGTNLTDRITGSSGADTIVAGKGNDTLIGAAGNDIFRFNLGDGIDTIYDNAVVGEQNQIVFGPGVVRENLRFERNTDALKVWYSDNDALVLPGFKLFGADANVVAASIGFSDGTTASLAELIDLAPVASSALSAQATDEDAAFVFQIPANAFTDADEGDVLVLSAEQADGSALPGWLRFDPVTRSFTGTPTNDDVGSVAVKVLATDLFGKSAAQTFELAVNNVNDAPIVANAIGAQTATEDEPFSFTIAPDAFADIDAGDTLVLSATLANGDPLPAWLIFDPAAQTFVGRPGEDDLGNLSVQVTATDSGGLTASSVFSLHVAIAPDRTLIGTEHADTLTGASGNDTLDGAGGADVLIGKRGNDTYTVDHADDLIVEKAGEGTDTVHSSIDWTLGANLENLALLEGAVNGTGNALNNVITGNAANNLLDGAAGADTLAGGAGDDTYLIDDHGDRVEESAGEGTDTVIASIDVTLAAHADNLTLTGAAVQGTGNELDNVIVGNELNNVLSGEAGGDLLDGAQGADMMIGGDGDDTYVMDQVDDEAIETLYGGNDTVRSSVSTSLGYALENLVLTGTGDLAGTGNALANLLSGNAGNNLLDGGEGADTMAGGAGNDSYIVDHAGDAVIEFAGAGIDEVYSLVSHTLSEHVEHLTLTGSADVSATGNVLDNVLLGNAGHNLLDGGEGGDTLSGGAGNDGLQGGAGDDTYVYHLGDGLDWIADAAGIDTVRFSTGLTLDNVALRIATVDGAQIAQVRILGSDGCEQADQGFDFAVNVDTNGQIVSPIEHFVLANGEQLVLDDLLIKQITMPGSNKGDTLTGSRNDDTLMSGNGGDTLSGGTGNDVLGGDNGADLLYGGGGNDTLDAGNDNDYADAGAGHDRIWTGNGNDVVQAGSGNDTIDAGNGNDLIDAGDGDDIIAASNGHDWIAGGKGNDIIDAGSERNLFAFNRGDGADTIRNSLYGNDTISLGKGIRYADLALAKSGNDLVLGMGDGESITLQDWYLDASRQGIGQLQVVASAEGGDFDAASSDKTKNRQVALYDFAALVSQFDAARTATPAISQWAVMNGLLEAHLSGSDTAAIGADLSYQYAMGGGLSGVGLAAAQDILSSANLNKPVPQALHSQSQLEQGLIKLG
jgi:Ca2+-binding RTX toxin-like protein